MTHYPDYEQPSLYPVQMCTKNAHWFIYASNSSDGITNDSHQCLCGQTTWEDRKLNEKQAQKD